jgi:hypothetical protein
LYAKDATVENIEFSNVFNSAGEDGAITKAVDIY